MPVRTATAEWKGNLPEGSGKLSTETGVLTNAGYTFASRFESGVGTNPEELIGAAHAGCFAMALSNELAQAGHTPDRVNVRAEVELGDGAITGVTLHCEATVPGIDESKFHEIADAAKSGCPVSKALSAIDITLEAKLAR